MAAERIGVDLGGTKIEAVALAADGRVVARQRCATPAGDYGATVRAIADLVTVIRQHCPTAAGPVGVGTPGSVRPDGTMHNGNSTWLNGRPLPADLARALGSQVRLANDANCMVLSEAKDGAASGAASVFGVILGTGVGGGLLLHGALVAGANGLAGEWGHNPLPGAQDLPGAPRECWCGGASCIETWLSGPGLLAMHRARAPTAAVADAEALVAAALAGDAGCAATLALWRAALGRALATVVNLLDPAVVVLAGGLSQVPGLAQDLPALVQPHVFSSLAPATRYAVARHGASSGVRGAAWLWPIDS